MLSSQFSKMMLAFAAIVVLPEAAAQISDIDLLTCNLSKGTDFPSPYWDHLHYHETKDGTFVVPGPVREQELCIQNATIAAGFGAYMVTAELCNSTPQPIFDWLSKNRPSLHRGTSESKPGFVASFGSDKDKIVVFHGRATGISEPDPTERQLSYACVVAGSGPQ